MLAELGIDDLLDSGSADCERLDLYFQRDLYERSFYEYVKAAWPLVEPTMPFVPNWHVEVLCKLMMDVYYKKLDRVIVNIPPGTMKSLLIEVFFPTWVWALTPAKRFLMASYGQHLTTRDNLRARQIIESPWYQQYWSVRMLEDQNTKTRYNTKQGGWRIATSVRGMGTGEHPDFIFIDDPTTAQQANSEAERSEANDWFDRTVSTRLARNPGILVIMQRLNEDDLSGHLLARGGWLHVCWPMRYEPTIAKTVDHPGHTADPLDRRTEAGELLFPALFSEERVRQLELDLGPYGAAGQLQQRPAPEGGGLFKRGWFKFIDVLPKKILRQTRGWDTASTEGGGDYTVGVKLAETEEFPVIVVDVQRDQLSPDGVDKLMKATADLDTRVCPQREEREGGASGKGVIGARLKLLKGYDYKEVSLGQNKVVRAKPFRSQCEGGNVYLLRAPWNEAYIQELCGFPAGKHDDQVDGTSCAYNSLVLEPVKRKISATWS